MDFGKGTLSQTLQPQPRKQTAAARVAVSGGFTQPTLTAAPAAPAPGGDICPAALNLARFGQPGPAAPSPASLTAPDAPQQPGSPKNLNALLGQ